MIRSRYLTAYVISRREPIGPKARIFLAPYRSTLYRLALYRSTSRRSAPFNSTLRKLASRRSALPRSAPHRSAPRRSALRRLASLKSASLKSASRRSTPFRMALRRSALYRSAPLRLAPLRLALFPPASSANHAAWRCKISFSSWVSARIFRMVTSFVNFASFPPPRFGRGRKQNLPLQFLFAAG